MLRRLSATASALALLTVAGHAGAENPLFPFLVSYDAPDNITNVSSWLDRPAGKNGHVRVENGHFATDKGPIRFWATNLCFEGCFPTEEQADRLAARLARFGINCVRMHHMDNWSIWGDSPNKLTIDPRQLDRLDYLVWQLKQHGIYTNINLHVSRTLGPAEGLPAGEGRPNYDKGLGNFEPRMIELQKKYARDLLTHVNQYTKTAYAQEPAVAFVEISNEDALFNEWSRRGFDNLPEPYATTFREVFNAWLRAKYGDTQALAHAWKVGARSPGSELLTNGDFSQRLSDSWHLQRNERTDADAAIDADGPDGSRCLKITVRRKGAVAWMPQVASATFAVKKGERYAVTFDVRCDRPLKFGVNCMMADKPWNNLGFYSSISGTTTWKRHRLTFTSKDDCDGARITFTGLQAGMYLLANVSLRAAGIRGLDAGQRIEDDTVPVMKRAVQDGTQARRNDFIDFLWDTESDYWLGMYRFLKDDLKVRAPVSGTQLSYGPAHIQAQLDYIDAHSYWMHPRFPNRPWDRRDWYVHNAAMVNDPPGTLGSLAGRRVAGMAYTVSEYNHPQPIQYAAEGFPMIAAFGAYQAWDGIYSFAYAHNREFEPRRLSSYFDIKGDPSRLAHMPACAAMFLRGDVAPAEKLVIVHVSETAARRQLRDTLDPWEINAVKMGIARSQVLSHGVAMDLNPDDVYPPSPPEQEPTPSNEDQSRLLSDTGQLGWDVAQKDAAYFIANTPRTKLFTGFVRGRTFGLGNGVKLAVGETQLDWATVTLTTVEGEGFEGPGRILIAATGLVKNTGAELEKLGDGRVTLRDRWGDEPVLCEGIPATITLPVDPARLEFYPLDKRGDRREAVTVTTAEGQAVVTLDGRHKTIWYEVVIK